MPQFETVLPIARWLKSIGVPRFQNARPSVSDVLSPTFSHPAPGHLAGLPAFGIEHVIESASVGNPSTIVMGTDAPGGILITGFMFLSLDNGLVTANCSFQAVPGLAWSRTPTHAGGRQFDQQSADPVVTGSRSLGRALFFPQNAIFSGINDDHGMEFQIVNDVFMPMGVFIPPGYGFGLGSSPVTNVTISVNVFYELLPYEGSAASKS